MQDRVTAGTDPKNRSAECGVFQPDSRSVYIWCAGDFKMSDKPELRVIDDERPERNGPAPLRPSSDVASQTARALFKLRESLLRGEFAPGERMSELPLVARLGVSRTPIRLARSEEHTSELQSQSNLVCRLLLEKKKSRKRKAAKHHH